MNIENRHIREIKKNTLLSIYHAKSGHPGGALSAIEIIAYLFFKEMNQTTTDLDSQDRDRFILSKGHSAPALYAVAAELDIISKKSLSGYRKMNQELQGHTHRVSTPWVEASTGSLGQGFSFAIGEALGLKMKKIPRRVYVMLGDGELQEGEVWEGAMFAAHHQVANLCAIIDYNKMQSDNLNSNIIGLEPLKDKWESFGWNVLEINGHDLAEIELAFSAARTELNKPSVIIAHTMKGHGVSYMENSPLWHGSVKLSIENISQALLDIGISENEISEYINE